MRILVLGGAGYIGSTLFEHLLRKHEITIVDNLMYNQGHLVRRMHPFILKQDAREISKVTYKNFDVIIPLAAYVGMPICDKFPKEAISVNYGLIKDLCNMLAPSQWIIFPNTNSGYGTTDEICTEETPLNSISLYGHTKELAEKIIMQRENSVCFRLATVMGPSYRMRLDLLVNQLAYSAHFNKHIDVFEGNFMRNFVHIHDVCNAFLFAIDNFVDLRSNVYNIGNDNCNCTKLELVNIIAEHYNATTGTIDRSDPDKRNYKVSSKKIIDKGFRFVKNLDTTLFELKYYYNFLSQCPKQRQEITKCMYNIT